MCPLLAVLCQPTKHELPADGKSSVGGARTPLRWMRQIVDVHGEPVEQRVSDVCVKRCISRKYLQTESLEQARVLSDGHDN
jgi:hypothetical protein